MLQFLIGPSRESGPRNLNRRNTYGVFSSHNTRRRISYATVAAGEVLT